jgi:acyl-CoA reductase-like NAD-dependent aldehyde dehydrogenase
MGRLKLFIYSRSVSSTGAGGIPLLDKATGETIAVLPESSPDDGAATLASAQAAFAQWRQRPAYERPH